MSALMDSYTLIVSAVAVVGSTAWLGYRIGVWKSSSRITKLLKNDRNFGIAILEELAQRWGVKVERQETPGPP